MTSVVLASLMLVCDTSASAHPPTGIVVDHRGNVYFSDLETIWKLEANGGLKVVRQGVTGRHVHELSIDQNDNVYGADISYESQRQISAVWKITATGDFSYIVAPTSNPPRASGIWHDANGAVYFVEQDNRTKKETLLLRRTADGSVSVLAGSSYGRLDGKGSAAKLGSIGGMVIGPDGNIYLTDNTALRKVSVDGTVTSLALELNRRTPEDRAPLFGKNDGIITGIGVDAQLNVYVCDAGNQRVLRVNKDGKVEVIFRGEEPYYANGVVVAPDGHVYLLEVGFEPPSTWLPARVRKLNADGSSQIVAVTGDTNEAGVNPTSNNDVRWFEIMSTNSRIRYVAAGAGALLLAGLQILLWKRRWRSRIDE
jgi:sugar lactone lactonase YvrE